MCIINNSRGGSQSRGISHDYANNKNTSGRDIYIDILVHSLRVREYNIMMLLCCDTRTSFSLYGDAGRSAKVGLSASFQVETFTAQRATGNTGIKFVLPSLIVIVCLFSSRKITDHERSISNSSQTTIRARTLYNGMWILCK